MGRLWSDGFSGHGPAEWRSLSGRPRAGCIYLSPRGLACRLLPSSMPGENCAAVRYTFMYLSPQPSSRDQAFTLSSSNVRLLRELR
jgi:hypothetical protein